MGRPWSAWDRAARFARLPVFAPPHVPRNRRPEIGSPKRSEAERFSPFRKRDRTRPQTRSTNIRVKDDQSTLRAHSRSLTSASGCTPPRTSDASPAVPPATRVGEDLIHPQPRFHLDSPLFNRRPPLDRQLAPHQPDEIPHRRVDPQVQVPAHHRAVQRAPERPRVRPRSPHPAHALAAKRVPARQRHRRTRLALAAEIPQAHRASKIVAESATDAVQGRSGGGSGAFILTDTRPRRVVWRQGRQRG